MASIDQESPPRASGEFVDSSILESIVPAIPSINIREVLRTWESSVDDPNSSVLPVVPQRQFLFFDENVSVFVILRTPRIEESTLKSYLSRLAINLEAYAVSTAPSESQSNRVPPVKELLYSEAIKDSYEPEVIILEPPSGSEAASHIYVAWKVDVFLPRPRQRIQRAAIYFSPSASLKPAERVETKVIEDEYLPSQVPTATNLLQSFAGDPGLGGIRPRLSALRITKVAPSAAVAKELLRPIRNGPKRPFRVAPAILWRVRYSKWQRSRGENSMLAMLDLEVTSFAGCEVSIEEVHMTLPTGRVESFHDLGSTVLPLVSKPGDHSTLIYKLIPAPMDAGHGTTAQEVYPLDMKIHAQALVSSDCRPRISIAWRTMVDFSATPDSLGDQAKLPHPTDAASSQRSKPLDPDSLPTQEEPSLKQEQSAPEEMKVSLTISGPEHVNLGETFQWNVLIVNRSEQPRRFALTVLPKRRRADSRRHNTHPSSSSLDGRRDGSDIASAVVDDNIVYAQQKNARLEPAKLICLSTEVRVGPLAPSACYTAELKFLALESGVLSVEALRVVDVATQEATDIRDLPSIVVLESEPEQAP